MNHRRIRSWYCVQVHHKAEDLAQSELQRQGYETFCPRHESPDRRDRKGQPLILPMWSGYVFVSWPTGARWYPVMSTRGVKQFMSVTPNAPQAMPLGVVERLKAFTDSIGVVDPACELDLEALPAGHQAEVIRGQFAGQRGLVQMSDAERTTLLFIIFGKQVPITFRRRDVQGLGQPEPFSLGEP